MLSDVYHQFLSKSISILIQCSRGPLQKLTVSHLAKNIPHILWNLKIHYTVHNRLPLVNTFSPIKSVQALPFYSLKPVTRTFTESLSFTFSHKVLHKFLFSSTNATHLAHLILLDLITLIIHWGLQIMKLHTRNFLWPPATSPLLKFTSYYYYSCTKQHILR